MNNLFNFSFIFLIIIAIVISVLSPISLFNYEDFGITQEDIFISKSGFTWPIPNKYYLSSYFGYRDLKLQGSGPFHSGIDIPASEGTYFLATMPGKITYLGFSGSGGYTIILENGSMKAVYCHTSPDFLVKVRRFYRTITSYRTSWST